MIIAMTRKDQIDAVANVAGITREQARSALDAVAAVVRAGLEQEDERVSIVGLGAFSLRHRSPRLVRNPRTGVMMDLPASVSVRF
jgi:DNA-binding protein HU-beta